MKVEAELLLVLVVKVGAIVLLVVVVLKADAAVLHTSSRKSKLCS